MYLERLSVDGIPELDYYKPNGTYNTSSPNSSVQMPNCTMYCYCRGFEAMEATSCIPWVRPQGGFGNAKTWYSTTTLAKGSTLKTGSVAVFDGNYGHVAFVERKIDATHAIISESNYDDDKSLRNWKYWQKREVELVVGKSTLSGIGPLIGFIYLPINDIRVNRDKSKEQVLVKESSVRVRKTANGKVYDGLYCPLGYYNVLKYVDKGSYKWAKLAENYFIAVYDNANNCPVSWAVMYNITEEDQETIADLKKQITTLKSENKTLSSLIKTIKTKLTDLLSQL